MTDFHFQASTGRSVSPRVSRNQSRFVNKVVRYRQFNSWHGTVLTARRGAGHSLGRWDELIAGLHCNPQVTHGGPSMLCFGTVWRAGRLDSQVAHSQATSHAPVHVAVVSCARGHARQEKPKTFENL